MDDDNRMPVNIEAEKSLIGAIFINNRVYEEVSQTLKAEHFALAQHQVIYEAIGKLVEKGVADPVTLKNMFEWDGNLQEIGGPSYLGDLAGSGVSAINGKHYAKTILDLAVRRQVIFYAQNLLTEAHSGDVETTAETLISLAETKLSELSSLSPQAAEIDRIGEHIHDTIGMIEENKAAGGGIKGLPTGLTRLDNLLSGIHNANLIVLAGRPAMGKTACAVSIQRDMAKRGEPTAIFSMEMSKEELNARWIAQESGIDSTLLRDGTYADDKTDVLKEAGASIGQWPIYVDDSPYLTTGAIKYRARKLLRKHGIKAIVIDHLGLIQADNPKDTPVNRISQITRDLKILAKELDIPVIALCQLSRAVEQRDDKRPIMSDLRDSGSIEQDADVIIFIYRHHYYLKRAEPIRKDKENDMKFNDRVAAWQADCEACAGLVDAIVAKQRQGASGTVKLHFKAALAMFGNLN